MEKEFNFNEQKATNKALKATSLNKVRAAILAKAALKEDKVHPFAVKVLKASKKDSTLYKAFVSGIKPNAKGIYSDWYLLSFIRKNAAALNAYITDGVPLPELVKVAPPKRKTGDAK